MDEEKLFVVVREKSSWYLGVIDECGSKFRFKASKKLIGSRM